MSNPIVIVSGIRAECHKVHSELGGRTDGCLEYEAPATGGELCGACGCHKSFHRRANAIYSKCNKIHLFGGSPSVDGCQEFKADNPDADPKDLTCAHCGCLRGFHRNDVAKAKD